MKRVLLISVMAVLLVYSVYSQSKSRHTLLHTGNSNFVFKDNAIVPQTIIDTIYTENSLQAGLFYFVEANSYSGGVLPFYQDILCVGDVYLWDYPTNNICSRHYLSFSIELIPDEYTIENVILRLYQNYCCGDGNDNAYPLFYGNQISCMIDHVDYGLTFEYSDFNPTIYGTIGAISAELTYGWKELNITNAYLQDMNQSRPYCQVMIYFPILTDYDFQDDLIFFRSSYFNDSTGIPQIVVIQSSHCNVINTNKHKGILKYRYSN